MESGPMDHDDMQLATALRERGGRVTPQRIAIARALRRLDRHASAEEVTAAVARDLKNVSVPTVYATLDLLSELGLARRITVAPRAVMYDPRTDDHHHAVCDRCGRVDDIDAPLDPELALRSARDQGFEPDRVDLVVTGLCADCHAGQLVPATARPTLIAEPMSLLEQVKNDTKDAMRAGDRERVGALRLITNELQKAHKDAAGTQADEVAVLQRERKRRIEAAEAYREAAREDLAEGEEREAAIIEAYLPAQMSEEELRAIVGDVVAASGAASPKEMGKVMSQVMPRVQGRADGKRVSAVVKELLTA
jgi:uncharacterized protein YqeY/Fe2+ or Zn2+ uptake regulation protein